MTTHTPGPWEHSGKMLHIGKRAANGSLDCIADVRASCFRENREANARLIAAAPELLAACRSLLNACEGIEEAYGSETIEYAIAHKAAKIGRAAIAKATGQA